MDTNEKQHRLENISPKLASMLSMSLTMSSAATPDEAPNYDTNYKIVRLEQVIVVGKGTESGAPTVDLQLVDADGNKFVVMTTGRIMEAIGVAAKNRRELDGAIDQQVTSKITLTIEGVDGTFSHDLALTEAEHAALAKVVHAWQTEVEHVAAPNLSLGEAT